MDLSCPIYVYIYSVRFKVESVASFHFRLHNAQKKTNLYFHKDTLSMIAFNENLFQTKFAKKTDYFTELLGRNQKSMCLTYCEQQKHFSVIIGVYTFFGTTINNIRRKLLGCIRGLLQRVVKHKIRLKNCLIQPAIRKFAKKA